MTRETHGLRGRITIEDILIGMCVFLLLISSNHLCNRDLKERRRLIETEAIATQNMEMTIFDKVVEGLSTEAIDD